MIDDDRITGGPARFRRMRDLPRVVERAISYADVPGENPEIRRTKHLFIAVLWISLVTTFVSLAQLAAQDAPVAALASAS